MAEKVQPTELSIELPISLLKKSTGFALDMGGSVLKMAYLDKKEWEGKDMDNCTDSMATVYLMSFPATKLNDALTFMKENFYIRRTDAEQLPVVYTSGVGLQRHGKKIEELLGVRVENVIESECFIRAAQYCVQHVPESMISGPPPIQGITKGVQRSMGIVNFNKRQRFGTSAPTNQEPWEYTDTLTAHVESALEVQPSDKPKGDKMRYPILLAMLGSGFGFMKVQEDGVSDVSMKGLSPIGGRTFISLGGLLTGAKDYDELMELAVKGNDRALNVYIDDMVSNTGKQDSYSCANTMDLFIYALGKGCGKTIDDFSREDLACSVHHLVTHNLINMSILMMEAIEGCRDLVVAGSFANHPLTRDVLAEEFLMQSTKKCAFERKLFLPKIHLLSIGGHLGAIGALLHGCQL